LGNEAAKDTLRVYLEAGVDDLTPFIVTLKRDEYDLASSVDLGMELKATYSHPNVILDLSAVTYLDSTCLSRLVAMRNHRVKSRFRPARLVLPSGQVRHVFRIVKFDEVWPIYKTLKDALKDALAEAETDAQR
jgi:anti-anti-sigma factor